MIDQKAQTTPDDFIMESAPGVARHDVEKIDHATVKKEGGYAARTKIYPKESHGTFRRAKWIVMTVTLGIYYLVPWIRWTRPGDLPDQAILFDFANQRLYFGPLEIWAQEFYYVTGLLVLSALGLFLVTSVAGRMWCGYACPQTVWTDLMVAIERFWQGDRAARIRLDKASMSFEKAWKKTATHISWLLVGLLTGGALVFYFRDAPTLATELVNGTAPAVAYAFLGIFTITTYLLGGIAREQVCIYMCPWPRIQGAMLDHDSLIVSYRTGRGEPRAPYRRGDDWSTRGDCIDCKACVAVCPTGIDIRDGAQLECIQCALCIDACDDVMKRLDRPTGLIAYATIANAASPGRQPRAGWRILRPRTMLYSALMLAISSVMVWSLLNRGDLHASVAPDRNPLWVTLSDGSIRNGYTLHIVNKLDHARNLTIEVAGLPATRLTLIGYEDTADGVIAPPADVLTIKAYVVVGKEAFAERSQATHPIVFRIREPSTDTALDIESTFHGAAP